jgi:hypothetical protein
MKLPEVPQEPNLSPTASNWLFPGAIDGIGKSSLLASVRDAENRSLLIADPDGSCKALPGYIVDLPNWRECVEFLRILVRDKPTIYAGVGVDNINIFHDHLFLDFSKREGHPGDKNDMGKTWNKLTREWTTWLRDLHQALGGLFIATCHTNIIEIKVKGAPFSKYVPAMPGGGPRGTYRQTMEMFDIIGFMTKEPQVEGKELAPPKDARADTTTLQTKDVIVVHFSPSVYWEAKDNSHQLPAKITLPSDWREDWNTIISHWSKEEGV